MPIIRKIKDKHVHKDTGKLSEKLWQNIMMYQYAISAGIIL